MMYTFIHNFHGSSSIVSLDPCLPCDSTQETTQLGSVAQEDCLCKAKYFLKDGKSAEMIMILMLMMLILMIYIYTCIYIAI